MKTEVDPYFINNEISIPKLSSYPWELEDSWVHVCKTNNKRNPYIVSFYNNKDYKRGTIIYSEFIYHKHPTSYVIFNESNLAERMYTNPKNRGRGYWKWIPLVLRCFFYNNLEKIYLDGSPERSLAAEKAYKKAVALLKQKSIYINNGRRVHLEETTPPRDPAFPYIWYNQRVKEIGK
jgi:hypothetical protein